MQPGVNERLASELKGGDGRWARLTEAAIKSAGLVHASSFTGKAEQNIILGLPQRLTSDQVLSFTPHNHVSELGLDRCLALYARVNLLFVYQSHLNLLVRRSDSVRRDLSPIHAVFDWRRRIAKAASEPLVVVVKATDDEDGLPHGTAKSPSTSREITIYDGGPLRPVGLNPSRLRHGVNEEMRVADSTGVGDATAAAVIAGLWNDLELEATIDLAQVMARLAGTGVGSRKKLPDLTTATETWQTCYGTNMPKLARFSKG